MKRFILKAAIPDNSCDNVEDCWEGHRLAEKKLVLSPVLLEQFLPPFHVCVLPETPCVSSGGGEQPCAAAESFDNVSLEESPCSSRGFACLRLGLTV